MHVRPPAHGMVTNLPFAHCAKAPLMQAFSPDVHDDAALRVANLAFKACASLPFWRVNDARRSAMGLATAARTRVRRGRKLAVENMVEIWLVE